MLSFLKRKTPIDNLEHGMTVVIVGKVEAREHLAMTDTQIQCVLYDKFNEAFETPARGRGRPMWVAKNLELRSAGFYVNDGNGKVWVTSETDGFNIKGGKQESGYSGKKNKRRYSAQYVKDGDTVRVSGTVEKPKGAEPADGLVMRKGPKGKLEVIVKKQS